MSDAIGPPPPPRWRKVSSITAALAVGATAVAYPLLVYSALTTDGQTKPGWGLAWLLVPLGISVLASLRAQGPWLRRVLPPLSALVLVGVGLALNSIAPLLIVPVVINTTLLVAFGSTLYNGPPLIERFARLQHPDLTPNEVAWCRGWTKVWTAFFATNIVVATGLVLTQRLHAWAVYNGLLTYIVMASFFVGEYSVRKYRFGRYDSHALDRLLQWCFTRSESRRRDRVSE